MDPNLRRSIEELFEKIDEALRKFSPRKLDNLDDLVVIYANTVNGKPTNSASHNLIELWQTLQQGGKPIGLLTISWVDSERMSMVEFSGLSEIEQELLVHAYAEAQDEIQDESLGD